MSDPSALRVLAIDDALIVAMDIELILTAALPCAVEVLSYAGAEAALAANHGRFDVVVLDTDAPPAMLARVVALARAAGAAIVFGTADTAYAAGVPGFAGAPVLTKPYDPQGLVEAVRRAAEGRRGPATAL